jgi:hypothetical protein
VAFKQFESYKVTNCPCVIVIYDARSFFTYDYLFESKVASQIIGNGHYIENKHGKLHEIYRTKGFLQRREKDYISGLAIIRRYDNELVFYHNPCANISLRGSYLLKSMKRQYVVSKMESGTEWISLQLESAAL